MDSIRRGARWGTAIGTVAIVAGLGILFGYALTEVLADPTISLADGYWIGRLPWTALGLDLAVGGATLMALAGVVAAWLAGGAIRRVVTASGLVIVAFWWFIAVLPQSGGAPCATCPPPGRDPITVAYSNPAQTILLLLVPAMTIGVLALTPRGSRDRAAEAWPARP